VTTGYDEIAVAGPRQLAAVQTNEPIREQTAELVALDRARDGQLGAEHQAGDVCQIEIAVDHLAEVACLCG
jgi:hypothetical protein